MKKYILIALGFIALFLLANMQTIPADGTPIVCCEKTISGGECFDVPLSECAPGAQYYNTACDSTTTCQLGTCFSASAIESEATCLERTPKKVCEEKGMSWSPDPQEEVPSCTLGCCENFGTLTTEAGCNSMSAANGLEIQFDPTVQDQAQCSSIFTKNVEGACAYNEGGRRKCSRETDTVCEARKANSQYSNVDFYEGYLCSDKTVVKADCGPSEQTTCVPGADGVYFLDTCGNLANIYYYSKKDNQTYWSKILPTSESCTENPAECGNCDSGISSNRGDGLLGTTCKPYDSVSNSLNTVEPRLGNNICANLGCIDDNGNYRKHGESWCSVGKSTIILDIDDLASATDKNVGPVTSKKGEEFNYNAPGTTYSTKSCWNGEIIEQMCDSGKAEVCVQTEINGWNRGMCVTNKWQDCTSQTNKADCLDKEKRYCNWFEGGYSFGQEDQKNGYCAPVYTPGFDFWENEGNGDLLCSQASIYCPYRITKSVIGGREVEDGSKCVYIDTSNDDNAVKVKQEWVIDMEKRCMRIGDCGPKNNAFGFKGSLDPEDFWRKVQK
jgi:hypothetical protein